MISNYPLSFHLYRYYRIPKKKKLLKVEINDQTLTFSSHISQNVSSSSCRVFFLFYNKKFYGHSQFIVQNKSDKLVLNTHMAT